MEQYDAFTLRNWRMQAWLAFLIVVAGTVAAMSSPAYWMIMIGMLLIASGYVANSIRTGQWYTWQRWDRSISWYEGWAVLSGAVITVAPLADVLVRARSGW